MRRLLILTSLCLVAVLPQADAQIARPGTSLPTPAADLPPPTTGIVRGRARLADAETAVRRAQVQLSTENGGTIHAVTDDDGRYEFRDVPAGSLEVSARKPGFVAVREPSRRRVEQERHLTLAAGQALEGVDFTFVAGGVVTGQVFDESGETVIGAIVQLARPRDVNGRRRTEPAHTAQTDDRGEFRLFGIAPGDYYLSARHPVAAGADASGAIEYAVTYFPGVVDRTHAERVSIEPGDEMMGFSITLQRTKSARITGVVRGATIPQGTIIQTYTADGDPSGTPGGSVQPDGSFAIAGVAPGPYSLTAIDLLNRDLTAHADVVVGDGDVTGIVLTLQPGVKARGRITFDEPRPADLQPGDVRIIAAGDRPDVTRSEAPPTAHEDWTFELSGLSGRHLLAAAVLAPAAQEPWTVASVRRGDVDVTDTGIDFGDADVDDIEIVLTRRHATLSGLVSAGGRPAVDATVLLFADDPSRWGLSSRYIGTARPDQTGRYSITVQPTGRYRVIALDEIEEGEDRDPDRLTTWRDRATFVELHDGEMKALDLDVTAR